MSKKDTPRPPATGAPPAGWVGAWPPKPSILDAVAAVTRSRRWDFTPEQRTEIAEVFAAVDAGTLRIGMARLAAVLKDRFGLPWSIASIRDRLLYMRSKST